MTSRCVEGISRQREAPSVSSTGGHRKVVISTKTHKKRTTRQKRKLDPKKVLTWIGVLTGVLSAVKLLVEIIQLIFSH